MNEIPLFGRVETGSRIPPESARKSLSLALSRLNRPGCQSELADALNVSDATISRIKSDSLSMFCELLDLLDLQVLDKSVVAVDPRAFESAAYLTSKAMRSTDICQQILKADE